MASEFANGKDEEIFGEGPPHRGRSDPRHHGAPGKPASPDKAANTDIQVARKLWTLTVGELKHTEDHMLLLGRKNAMEGRDLPARDGHPAPRRRPDGRPSAP
ncbi:hypothetical protein ACVWWG_001619 [Bradyrhizobium sp. LB7.2]